MTLNRDPRPRRDSRPCGCTSMRTSATQASPRRRSPRRTPSRYARCTGCSSPRTTASARSFASAGSAAATPICWAGPMSRSPRSPTDGDSATYRSSAACSVSDTACPRASCRPPHARRRDRRPDRSALLDLLTGLLARMIWPTRPAPAGQPNTRVNTPAKNQRQRYLDATRSALGGTPTRASREQYPS